MVSDKINRIAATLIWLILWLLSWLPGFIMRFLSYLINTVVFKIFRYRSDVIRTNLSSSFPELSFLEQTRIAGQFHRHFSELFLEMIMIIRLKPNKQSRRIRFSNPEIINRAFEQKQNIILITGHFGNWEWNALPILAAGYRILGVYKPQSSKQADQLLKKIRDKPGVTFIPMKDTFRTISRELQKNNSPFVLALVADQIPARGDIRFWTTFLNQDTAFFTGGEKLARRFRFPVFYIDQTKLGFAKYEANITPLYDGVSVTEDGSITTAFVELLETSIRQKPYLWLWSHRRWKYRREELPLQV